MLSECRGLFLGVLGLPGICEIGEEDKEGVATLTLAQVPVYNSATGA